MKEFDPLVRLEQLGVMHVEGGKLMIGDTDVVKKFVSQWGGHRQQGVLRMSWSPFVTETVEVSPDGDGVFAEPSEPPSGRP